MKPMKQTNVQTSDHVWAEREQPIPRQGAQGVSHWCGRVYRVTWTSITRGCVVMLTLWGLLSALAPPAVATEGVAPERDLTELRLREVSASVLKCLAALDSVGPNEALDDKLLSIARKPGKERFVTSQDLADIEDALGTSTGLSERDLETCAAVAHARVQIVARTATRSAFEAPSAARTTVTGPTPAQVTTCQPGYSACIGTGTTNICCSDSDAVCSQTCTEGGECAAWCEQKWCFPSEATVRLDDGTVKAMRELVLGDRVQVARPDGSLGYDAVYLMTHKDASTRGRYLTLALASGQSLTLSPRHFVPTAPDGGTTWASHILKGADEVKVGDMVWYRGNDGTLLPTQVTAVTASIKAGAFNPMTVAGTVVVDGVVASTHSDWFLDGIASAAVQAQVYQVLFAPVRGIYRVIGPQRMAEVTERWGVVDFVREQTSSPRAVAWGLPLALPLFGSVIVWRWRRKRPPTT
jgi:Hint module